jgi:hypothetical protein
MTNAAAGIHCGAYGLAARGQAARPGTGSGGTHFTLVSQGLTETGYVVGSNVTIKAPERSVEQLPALRCRSRWPTCDTDCCCGTCDADIETAIIAPGARAGKRLDILALFL